MGGNQQPFQRTETLSQTKSKVNWQFSPNSCSLCNQKYHEKNRVPKIMLCGHTFCFDCLKQREQQSIIECPEDNTKSSLEDLKTNYIVFEFLEEKQQTSISTKRFPCKIHRKPLEFICLKCSELTCSSCMLIGNHKAHEASELVNSLEPLKKKFQFTLGKLKQLKNKAEILWKQKEQELKLCKESYQQCTRENQESCQQLIQKINDKRQETLAECSAKFNSNFIGMKDIYKQQLSFIKQIKNLQDPDIQDLQAVFKWIFQAEEIIKKKDQVNWDKQGWQSSYLNITVKNQKEIQDNIQQMFQPQFTPIHYNDIMTIELQTKNIKYFDESQSQIVSVPLNIEEQFPEGAQVLNLKEGRLLISGGYEIFSCRAILIDYKSDVVIELPDMLQCHWDHCTACQFINQFPSKAFVISGYFQVGEENKVASCEYFDFNNFDWYAIGEINIPVTRASACIFENEKIFVIGGETSETRDFQQKSLVQAYSIENDIWKTFQIKTQEDLERQQLYCLQHNSQLLIFGSKYVYSLDSLAIENQEFEKIKVLGKGMEIREFSYTSLVVKQNIVYIFDRDQKCYLFNIDKNEWKVY